MEIALITLTTILAAAAVVLLLVLLARQSRAPGGELEASLRQELRAGRQESQQAAGELRRELATTQKDALDSIVKTIGEMDRSQEQHRAAVTKRIEELTAANEQRMAELRKTVDAQLARLQESNERKLEQMRAVVDEKLQSTLEKRLGESFKIVGEQLEAVQRGLGEMQNLASGVGDLKRVLTNVKARGTWGEVQLGTILEELLTPDQYQRNVATKKDANERVEFAIKLPGRDGDPGDFIWLPIDAKFPQEDYLRLVEASEQADAEGVKAAAAALERAVKSAAKDIREKYIDPPRTTDFAILFLATEGLYAEVLRRPGLMEAIQREYRVVITGPTTLSATLNSLRMGFRTLAIEKRSSEVWQVLAAVKTEFGKFGDVLAKLKKHLQTASNTIEKTETRTRGMERKLREVEQLPADEASSLLELPPLTGDEDDEVEEGGD